MSVDREYRIRIVSTAETGGARETAAAMKEMGEAGAKAAEETAKKTTFLNLKNFELKKLVRELAHEFPIAGMAGRMMMNPIVASLTIGIGLFSKAKQYLDEWNKAMDAAAEKAAERDFLPGIEGKAASLREAAGAAVAFYRSIDDATKKEDDFTTSLKKAKGALQEYMVAQAEVDDAAKANEIAHVNLDQNTGKITELQAIAKRGEIDVRYRHKAEQLKTQAENIELQNQEAELANALKNRDAIKQAEAAARAVLDAKKARIAQAKLDAPALKKRLEDAEKEAAEAIDIQGQAELKYANAQRTGDPTGEHAWGAALEGKREAARIAVLQRDIAKRALNKSLGIGGDNTAWEEANLGLAADRYKGTESTIDRLQNEIPSQRANVAMRQDARRTASSVQDNTARVSYASELTDAKKSVEDKLRSEEKAAAALVKASGSLGETSAGAMRTLTQKVEEIDAQYKSIIKNMR